uniref:Uncharacterized protein n=1 Tax=Arundo donax TaxID=35708 RepID=A0A0A9D5J0_ARUDO
MSCSQWSDVHWGIVLINCRSPISSTRYNRHTIPRRVLSKWLYDRWCQRRHGQCLGMSQGPLCCPGNGVGADQYTMRAEQINRVSPGQASPLV